MKKNIWNQGFTLFEILIYISILAIISVAIVSFVLWAINFNASSKAAIEVQDNARRAMEIMTYEIREANSVYLPTSVFFTHLGQLSLETGLEPPAGETKTYKDFYLSNGVLYFKEEGSLPEPLTSDNVRVTNLVFRNLGHNASTTPDSIQIYLGAQYNNPTNRPEFQASTSLEFSVSLR
jgi:prepilin-type N-terminal cleavage/methylation domain-containing protein